MPPIPSAPTFEHHRLALGIGERRPRLSWKTVAEDGWAQVGYEIEVYRDGLVGATGRVQSTKSVLVPWPGKPLGSRDMAVVRGPGAVGGPRRPLCLEPSGNGGSGPFGAG